MPSGMRLTTSLWLLVTWVGLRGGLWLPRVEGAESASTPAVAAETATNRLTLERLLDKHEFEAEGGPSIQWDPQGAGYYTLENPATGSGKDLVWHDAGSDRTNVVVAAHRFRPKTDAAPLTVESYQFSGKGSRLLISTRSRRVWRTHSRADYWVYDLTSLEWTRLGGDAPESSLRFAKFSPDGTKVAWVRDNNLQVQDLRTLQVTNLTTNGSPTLINGTSDWVYEEELDLRDGFRWSPDSSAIAFWQIDSSAVKSFPLLNTTDSLYPTLSWIPYPKTGEQNSSARIGVVRVTGGEPTWVTLPGDPANQYIPRMDWASNSTEVLIQQLNRVQNTNRLWMVTPGSGTGPRLVHTETDGAWIDNDNPHEWVDNGRHLVWLSDQGGWRQAYRLDIRDGSMHRITKGDFDVVSVVRVEPKQGWLYYIASPDRATERYLYRARLDGGKGERLTPEQQVGTHAYDVAPDGRHAVHTWSALDRPPVIELVRLPDHTVVRTFTDNKALVEKLAKLDRPVSGFFRVALTNQVEADGWFLKPPGFDPARKYPVLVHVYGEPAGQTTTDAWHGGNQLWHWMLAQRGYVVVSFDNRGTPAPRGRAWRKAIHHQIGILNIRDQAEALRSFLKMNAWADGSRVAIWGWSGGGSSTLNALFQFPELYQVGMSVAPVPNQRLYDSIYQERYMGLPSEDPEGYRLGSPLTHARNLRGHLLLVHGTGDDNVHYQGTEALINELVAANKPFTFMAYPNRSHGISEGTGTRRHLFELLTRHLEVHLPTGPSRTVTSTP